MATIHLPSPRTSDEVIAALLSSGAAGFTRGKIIRFKQNILSPGAYINNRVLPSHPKEWHVVAGALKDALELTHNVYEFTVIASVATGAIPHGAVVAHETFFPHVIVKKEAKAHGVGGLIDGDIGVLENASVLLVEDMSSTFKSSLDAMRLLVEAGAKVVATLLINTWGFPQFFENIEAHYVSALCTGTMIVDAAERMHYIDEEYAALLRTWIQNPLDQSWITDEWKE